MFKKIFVSCLLISLFFSPGVQAEENWISHTEKRFSVHYPEGWSISTV
jgi:hypothetical protein